MRPSPSILGATVLVLSVITCNSQGLHGAEGAPPTVDAQEARRLMARVADWQIAHPPTDGHGSREHAPYSWTMGTLYVGMQAWSRISGTATYLDYLRGRGEANQWKLGPLLQHADDHCVGALYIELFRQDREPRMISAVSTQFDRILARSPPRREAQPGAPWEGPWSWCDALFMSPPVWAGLSDVTGDGRYRDYMDREWWSTHQHLYDADEHLYYRDKRYFDKREANGKKVFWGRGNGWVLAGLARVLQVLPSDYPSRPRYESLFKDMAARIAGLQQDDGLWRASLLDPERYRIKETSGSGFYCFALAWGVGHGLLNRDEYAPKVIRAWNALTGCVHADGKLGNVQPIGADPQKVTDDMTEVYGVGAFLLAGTEVLQMEGAVVP